ncbi:hypothetical protein C8R46DRAFT_1216606 [Mycena filopes]|nr:hypothetical protein C8R46DRAFT_1216606 [Mycena filopes]
MRSSSFDKPDRARDATLLATTKVHMTQVDRRCTEIVLMLPALQADRTRIADLDAQILDLERSIATIRAEKALVQERLDAYRFPVLTLPDEITSGIFLHFPPVYPACPPLYGTLSPTNLTQICREWRAVALATPSLWRAIEVSLFLTHGPVQTVDRWLSLSRTYPTCIELATSTSYSVADVMSVIAPHHARWEHLKLNCRTFFRQPLLELENPMPLLRRLDLAFAFDAPEGSIVLGKAPLLDSAALDDIAAHRFILPWLQLTSLTLTHIFFNNCIEVLRQTPQLLHCDLCFRISPDDAVATDLPLLCLQSLVLKPIEAYRRFNGGPSTDYLNNFTLPALRTLQVAETLLGPTPCNSVLSFFSASGCKLEKMCITGRRRFSKDAYRRMSPSVQVTCDGKYLGEGEDESRFWERLQH